MGAIVEWTQVICDGRALLTLLNSWFAYYGFGSTYFLMVSVIPLDIFPQAYLPIDELHRRPTWADITHECKFYLSI